MQLKIHVKHGNLLLKVLLKRNSFETGPQARLEEGQTKRE